MVGGRRVWRWIFARWQAVYSRPFHLFLLDTWPHKPFIEHRGSKMNSCHWSSCCCCYKALAARAAIVLNVVALSPMLSRVRVISYDRSNLISLKPKAPDPELLYDPVSPKTLTQEIITYSMSWSALAKRTSVHSVQKLFKYFVHELAKVLTNVHESRLPLQDFLLKHAYA